MSKIFYDHLINLDKVEKKIKKITLREEEKQELWDIVDEIVHHKVFGCIMDNLPDEHHEDFLDKFQKAPYDEGLVDYLSERIGKNFDELIKQELGNLAFELLEELKQR